MPRVLVLSGLGLNSEQETRQAFQLAGASRVDLCHANRLAERPEQLLEYDIAAFPGGFAHGDHVRAGRVLATLLRQSALDVLLRFINDEGRPVIGICNGFQVLLQLGIFGEQVPGVPVASLSYNDSGKFEDRWVTLAADASSPCIWTRGIERMDLPVRHGEGKIVFAAPDAMTRVEDAHQVPLIYAVPVMAEVASPVPYPHNPNGSDLDAAALCNPAGNVLGMMPHPEAFLSPTNHPHYFREHVAEAQGLRIFKNAVDYVKNPA